MTVSPNISAMLNLIAAIVSLVVGASAEWTALFGAGTAASIIAVAGLVGTMLTGINSLLHATSAPKAGLLASRQY